MKVENIGNACKELGYRKNTPYARNPWDMQLFENRIYIGAGNSVGNAGPVPLMYLDLQDQTFKRVERINDRLLDGATVVQTTIPEEQVELFQILSSGLLVIPGHDSRGQGKGYCALRTGFEWARVRGRYPSRTYHVFSLTQHKGRLFAGLGGYYYPFATSLNDGVSWTKYPEVTPGRLRHTINFTFGETLYSFGGIEYDYLSDYAPWSSVQWDDASEKPIFRKDLDARKLFPLAKLNRYGGNKLTRPVTFKDKLVYIGGVSFNDFDTLPHSLNVASSLKAGAVSVKGVTLDGIMPFDLLVREDYVYALMAKPSLQGGSNVGVIRSSDGVKWENVFTTQLPAFARSFEFDEQTGSFYLGLGSTTLGPDVAGDIVKVTI